VGKLAVAMYELRGGRRGRRYIDGTTLTAALERVVSARLGVTASVTGTVQKGTRCAI
jgi:hypothetical protein